MCHRCGHLFVDYRFSESEMQQLYNDYRGPGYTELRELYEPGYMERNRVICEGISYISEVEAFLAEFLPASEIAVLDWGGDTGTNTPFADRRSVLHIFDPSAKDAGLTDRESFSNLPMQDVESILSCCRTYSSTSPFRIRRSRPSVHS